jgi:hypothetical protein
MATFATLKNRVNKRLGLDDTSGGVDDVLLSGYLNDAVRDFLVRTRINVNRAEVPIDSETDDSELSGGVLAVNELYVVGSDSRTYTPIKTSPQQIVDWRRASVTSGSLTVQHYALQGHDLFMWYPALVEGTTVVFYYVPRPTEMVLAGNDPFVEAFGGIPNEFHPALEIYAAWQMADVDDDSTSQMGLTYQRQYLLLVKDAQRAMRRKGGRSLGPARVGRKSPYRYSNSQDLW